MSKTKYSHLVRNIPNTKENRDFVKNINKISKQSDSIYKLLIKYRKPKEGFKYGSGGSLKCENANAFSVYIQDRRPWREQPTSQIYARHDEIERKLNKKISRLERELAILKNPYMDWSNSSIEDEIFEIKESIVDGYLEDNLDNEVYLGINRVVDNHYGSITLKEKYNLLMEALEYAQKQD
jgi:hypothetical protein